MAYDLLSDLLALTVPHEDIDELLALSRTIDRSLLEPHVSSLVEHMGSFDRPPRFDKLPDQHPLFYVLVFLEMLPHVREYHRAHDIPATDSRVILADLGRQLAWHRRRFGAPGINRPYWLNFSFRGMIYQLGRLQFERVPYKESLALSLHIPEFCGPLSPEAVDDSLDRARHFFACHFPSEHYEFAVCHSWLLCPQLGEHLPAESNIMRFQARFTLAETGEHNDSFLKFVEPGTRLRSIVEDRIAHGESWLVGSGFFPLDGQPSH
ncbi:MAG TPA: acyltransferase domain-containing protein [Candidatus Limnocylindrales bacterium]|nr:acyltransferase domain-containing protein [Candidatus Limnocylindrales bacterium]